MSEKKNQDIKILIVDDSSFSRSVISKILKEEHFDIAGEAESAAEAMKLIQQTQPHIVITDIVMPEVSGLELTAQINKSHSQIFVIVVSSLSQEHIIIDAISAGAADFIAKPIEKPVLINAIQKIVKQLDV